jgi:serine/threonine protein kinase
MGTLIQKHARVNKIYPMDNLTVKLLMWQLFRALAYVHCKKILHRDVKPANILIGKNLKLVLADFGSAKEMNEDESNATYIC